MARKALGVVALALALAGCGGSGGGNAAKPTNAIEAAALGHASVFLNGGQRGLQVELDPNDAVKAAAAITQALTV